MSISIDNGRNSQYYINNNRSGADIYEFEVPKWLDDMVKEYTIPQTGYKNNPLNQEENDYKPSLYVEFDKKLFYSMYIEPASYEEYAPVGWNAKYESFSVLFQQKYALGKNKMRKKKMIEYLKKIVKNHNIEDVYLTGFVDVEDGVAQFYHDLRFVYFEIDSKYIEFESINQFSKLRIKIVDSVSHNIEIDEEMMKAKSSVSEIILNDTMANGNDIDSIIFYNLEVQEELICDAMEIKLVNGQLIFIDPSYYFGINIGGKEQKQMWELNLKDNVKVNETYIKISDK